MVEKQPGMLRRISATQIMQHTIAVVARAIQREGQHEEQQPIEQQEKEDNLVLAVVVWHFFLQK